MRRLVVAVLLAVVTVVASARPAGAHDCPPGQHEDTELLGVCNPDTTEVPSSTTISSITTPANSTLPPSTTPVPAHPSSSTSTTIGDGTFSAPSGPPSTPSSETTIPDGMACTSEDCGPWTTSATRSSTPGRATSPATPLGVVDSLSQPPPSSQLSTLPATGPDDPLAIAVAAIGAIAAGALLVLVFGRRR